VTRFLICASLAVIGAIATQLSATRYLPLAERLVWESWNELALFGAIGAALIGNLCLVAMKPLERVTRATLLCVLTHVLVWISFLVFNPPLTESEFVGINARRTAQDAQVGLDIVDDAPIVVAGRWSGTFGAVNAADYALHLAAGPAVTFVEWLVVPPRYKFSGIPASKGESHVIAGIAFVLSTSFWTAFGGGISAFRRAYQRRQAAG
jgi:hypothetical protein